MGRASVGDQSLCGCERKPGCRRTGLRQMLGVGARRRRVALQAKICAFLFAGTSLQGMLHHRVLASPKGGCLVTQAGMCNNSGCFGAPKGTSARLHTPIIKACCHASRPAVIAEMHPASRCACICACAYMSSNKSTPNRRCCQAPVDGTHNNFLPPPVATNHWCWCILDKHAAVSCNSPKPLAKHTRGDRRAV